MGEPTTTGTRAAGPIVLHGLDGLQQRVGQDLGASDWWTVEQDKIDQFATLTGDRQWIHVDPRRAAGGPFGAPRQHGFPPPGPAPGPLWEGWTGQGFGGVLDYR